MEQELGSVCQGRSQLLGCEAGGPPEKGGGLSRCGGRIPPRPRTLLL